MSFAWKFMLPLAAANLLLLSVERLIVLENEITTDAIWWAFAVVNTVFAVLAIYIWAKLLGYKSGAAPTRPRLFNEAGGYKPLDKPGSTR
ncbi:MAG: hypothetical protein U5Q44_03335 [Dehalococcoidia bacterium]|nr:hypothetical protein [Dehalococcoidia bacterium]